LNIFSSLHHLIFTLAPKLSIPVSLGVTFTLTLALSLLQTVAHNPSTELLPQEVLPLLLLLTLLLVDEELLVFVEK
jgi:hypothetical protein